MAAAVTAGPGKVLLAEGLIAGIIVNKAGAKLPARSQTRPACTADDSGDQCNRPDLIDRGFRLSVASTSHAMAPGVSRHANPYSSR